MAAGWTPGGWAAVGLLALLYVAIVVLRGPEIDPAAPAVGAGLLLSGELAALARDLFERRLADPRQLGRRLLVMAGLGLATVAVGWVLLVAWVGGLPGGVATTAIGAVAAVGTVAVLLPAARSLVTRR